MSELMAGLISSVPTLALEFSDGEAHAWQTLPCLCKIKGRRPTCFHLSAPSEIPFIPVQKQLIDLPFLSNIASGSARCAHTTRQTENRNKTNTRNVLQRSRELAHMIDAPLFSFSN
jgi:hypothetical protein